MKQKICLITGATGFIGQHLVTELVSEGYKIIALGCPEDTYCTAIFNDSKIKISTSLPLSSNVFDNNDIELIFGEIGNQKFVADLFQTIEKNNMEISFVLHLAACATIQQALANAEKTWHTNYNGTVNMLEESVKYHQKYPHVFKGFFYASTDKVYGEGSRSSYHETDELKPLPYPYDQSKAKADALVRQTAKEKHFPAVLYRFCNVYGPGDYHKSRIVPGTLHRLLYKNEAPVLKVYPDLNGKSQSFYRDMIYIKDLTSAIKLLLHHLEIPEYRDKLLGEAFNLGTQNSYPMKEVIKKILDYSGSPLKAKEEMVAKGEIKQQCMDYAKLNKVLGFKPQYTLDKGIKETVAWYETHKGEINDKFI